MAVVQAITPNPDVSCTPGWCLTYVDDAFDLEAHGKTQNYPTAISAWNASHSKHVDRRFPANCWVPVWFTLEGNPAGHVAILAPDGAVWSSSHPTKKTPVRHNSLKEIVAYYGSLGLSYLGWTEDVGGIAVVKEEDMIKDTDLEYARWEKLGQQIRGRSLTREEFRSSAVGLTWLKALEVLSDDPESDQALKDQGLGQLARRDDWEGQIHSLTAQLKGKPQDASEAEKKLQAIKDALDIK
ncbi:hypothetical protein J2X12_004238 [Pseudarthrobacter oxydans]|uniref:Uncharacterized protein n=1 Tax=Pseudarthrobacter oxydans TaxID=1671 RepID=A0AAW8NIA5_PSEOX|nr:hypothetical protein [Pseudarthrobacter oxydans]MDR6794747.1 hypothetical protein [Pseudarthrobacter oxydans]MDR7166184.1 hypothetical protein [Pseudarthrobacter oxydans]